LVGGKNGSKLSVFLGAADNVLTSLIAVGCGFIVGNVIPQQYLRFGAGVLFILFGILILFSK
jgi:putative Ca2+/H+ antiporter (TMEM165/GDT1 family)